MDSAVWVQFMTAVCSVLIASPRSGAADCSIHPFANSVSVGDITYKLHKGCGNPPFCVNDIYHPATFSNTTVLRSFIQKYCDSGRVYVGLHMKNQSWGVHGCRKPGNVDKDHTTITTTQEYCVLDLTCSDTSAPRYQCKYYEPDKIDGTICANDANCTYETTTVRATSAPPTTTSNDVTTTVTVPAINASQTTMANVVKCHGFPDWLGSDPDTKNVTIGTVVNYTCRQGYLPNGESWKLTNCSENGLWEPKIQECQEKEAVDNEWQTPEEAPYARVFGIVGIMFMSIMGGLIVGCDLTHFKRDVGLLRRNLRHVPKNMKTLSEKCRRRPKQIKQAPKETIEVVDMDPGKEAMEYVDF